MTKNEWEKMGKDVAEGRYVSKNIFFFTVILAFMLGGFLGNLVTVLQSDSTVPGASVAANTPANEQPHLSELQEAARLEELVKEKPQDIATWNKLGNLYYDAHQFTDAIRCYESSLLLTPNDPNILTDLGTMYRSINDYDKALAAFERAIILDPRHQFARLNKGIVLLYDMERTDEAKKTWEELLAIYPDIKTANGRSLRSIVDAL